MKINLLQKIFQQSLASHIIAIKNFALNLRQNFLWTKTFITLLAQQISIQMRQQLFSQLQVEQLDSLKPLQSPIQILPSLHLTLCTYSIVTFYSFMKRCKYYKPKAFAELLNFLIRIRHDQFPGPTRLALLGSPLQWLTAIINFVLSPILRYTRLQTSAALTQEHCYFLINKYRVRKVWLYEKSSRHI